MSFQCLTALRPEPACGGRCTETFLEGHVRAFRFFGGVPRRVAYDNTKVAVAKVVGSRERVVTKEFLRLTSYHLFESHFCLVRRPNEKGHVERSVDYARSNFLVPVPAVSSLAELNATLEEQCRGQFAGSTSNAESAVV